MSDPTPWVRAFHRHVAQTSPEPIGIVVERAEGPFVYTPEGRRYVDLLSGIGVANVGHTHPEVVAAVDRQNRRHHHVMVYGEYVQEEQAAYAAALVETFPAGMDRVYFVNSGAEAVETALKIARKLTGRAGFTAFADAYHGDTFGALSVAGNPVYQDPFRPLLGPVRLLPFGDAARLEEIDEATAAVIVEPVQGEGGVRIPPPGFLVALARRCLEMGALLILDEVLTGFGRTGTTYAWEQEGVVPDLLVLAKALGGGYPLGAVGGASALMETLTHDPPLAHVTTFGGHPVSCAAGRAALGVIRREGLAARSLRVGGWWRRRLEEELGDRAGVTAIRGRGMLIGVELDSAVRTSRWVTACRDHGLLLGWTLHRDHVVRLCPPLNTPEDVLDHAVLVMAQALGS